MHFSFGGPGEIVNALFSEIHYEVLEQFAVPLSRVGGGTRKFSPVPIPALVNLTWRLRFPGDLVPIADRLRGLQDLRHRLGDSEDNDNIMSYLPVIRLAEVIQIAWSYDRILDCDSSKFLNALFGYPSLVHDFARHSYGIHLMIHLLGCELCLQQFTIVNNSLSQIKKIRCSVFLALLYPNRHCQLALNSYS